MSDGNTTNYRKTHKYLRIQRGRQICGKQRRRFGVKKAYYFGCNRFLALIVGKVVSLLFVY